MNDPVGGLMRRDRELLFIPLTILMLVSGCAGFQTALFESNTPNKKQLSSCTTIDEPGRYELTTNITNGDGTRISQSCIEIKSGDVILDGNGHVIYGRGNSYTNGIEINTSRNVGNLTIENVIVTDWHKGIKFRYATQGELRNISALSNVYGITIENSNHVSSAGNTLRSNMIGIKVSRDSKNIQLQNNNISNNKADFAGKTRIRAHLSAEPSTASFF